MNELVKERMKRYTITMEPVDWATVFQVAKDFGLASRSAGVRFIIRDWLRMKEQQAAGGNGGGNDPHGNSHS